MKKCGLCGAPADVGTLGTGDRYCEACYFTPLNAMTPAQHQAICSGEEIITACYKAGILR